MRINRRHKLLFRCAVLSLLAAVAASPQSARADDNMNMSGTDMNRSMPEMNQGSTAKAVAGAYTFELHVGPAEPFYTAEAVRMMHPASGMVVVSGATAVAPTSGATAKRLHHLVVHVYSNKTGLAVTAAQVKISFRPLGTAREWSVIPVVEMQVISAGPSSTHYGNNVPLPAGSYQVKIQLGSASHTFVTHVVDNN